MKKATNRTKYVLIKAYTTSEWDNCDFAVLHVTDEWLCRMVQRQEKLKLFTDDDSFESCTYLDSPEGFYVCLDEIDLVKLLPNGAEWTFIEIISEQLESLPVPENKLCGYRLSLDKDGWIVFKAYGKHSGEQFYTASISITAFSN